MKRFNVKKELSRLERRKSLSTSTKGLSSLLVPFFVIGSSCVALTVASYSLDNTGEVNNIINEPVVDIVKEENTISDDMGTSKYFYNNEDRYINFNGMLFRVLRINGDGSLRIMLTTDINRDYYLSIDDNLKNWFNYYFSNNQYVVKNTFDNNIYYGIEEVDNLINLFSARMDYVGLLSYREYKVIYQYDESSSFYLESKDMYGNRLCNNNGMIVSCNEYEYYGIRPVINIKITKLVGEGTIDNPYIIEE